MNEIQKAVLKADEEYLISWGNKGIYKRALKDTEEMTAEFEIKDENSAVVNVSGETVTLYSELEKSTCSCVSRTVCRHIVGAVLLMKKSLPEGEEVSSEENKEPEAVKTVADNAEKTKKSAKDIKKEEKTAVKEEEKKALSEKDISKINKCAASISELLKDILVKGITRLPPDVPDSLEVAAVRCHSLKMADAERKLRELSGRLREYTGRKASFDIEIFTSRFLNCALYLKKLMSENITEEMLGTFRKSYEEQTEDISILPVGEREVTGGDYTGNIYYFLDVTKGHDAEFLSFSDLRPSFYDSVKRKAPSIVPWDLQVPLKSMMRSRMVLKNAKINEGRLSSSKDTKVLSSEDADLDCDEVRGRIICDFRKLAFMLTENDSDRELDRLFFINPEKCTDSRFDKLSQKYIMTLEDKNENVVYVTVKYSEGMKKYIELLENIGNNIIKNDIRNFTMLVIANIVDGELSLFPVEYYDFITPPPYEEFCVPYEQVDVDPEYPGMLLGIMSGIKRNTELVLQCGLSSGISPDEEMFEEVSELGMKGLAERYGEFLELAKGYRHLTEDNGGMILEKMAEVERYVEVAESGVKREAVMAGLCGRPATFAHFGV